MQFPDTLSGEAMAHTSFHGLLDWVDLLRSNEGMQHYLWVGWLSPVAVILVEMQNIFVKTLDFCVEI